MKKGDKIRYIHSGYEGEIGKIIKVEKDEKLDHFNLKYEVELLRNGHKVWVSPEWIQPLNTIKWLVYYR